MFLSRKEILSLIPGCGKKFDGVVRWADGIREANLGVVEVNGGNGGSVSAMGGKGDAGGVGMWERGDGRGRRRGKILRKVQVLGIVNFAGDGDYLEGRLPFLKREGDGGAEDDLRLIYSFFFMSKVDDNTSS
ncbi:hypothetical protein BGX38DRAFT_1143058 [Terfezia claveryi]|nr:hypothetical protein BGX38DRAFT_1143058 [Terfezia claveryi]